MNASKIFFVSVAPLLVLACGGASAPDIGGDAGASNQKDGGASSSKGGASNGNSGSFSSGSGSGSGSSGNGAVDSTGTSGSVKRVFVTSITYAGNLGGVAGADAKCQTAADAQVLSGSWKAWISSGSVNAIDRINDVGPWYLVDGVTKVFNNKANLLTMPAHAIDQTETGQTPSWMGYDALWSGSDQSGDASGYDCQGWTSNLTTDYGMTGSVTADQNWGGSLSGPLDCDVVEGLICFEQ